MVSEAGPSAKCEPPLFSRFTADMERLRQPSQLRPLLAGAGFRALYRRCESAHSERRRVVGSGRFLWSDEDLPGIGAARQRAPELSRGGTLEPRPVVGRRRSPARAD